MKPLTIISREAVELRIYVHPTCYSSYKLLKHLMENGLINRVKVIDTSNPSLLDRFVLSVPWVTIGSRTVAADPVSGEEVKLMIEGSYKPTIGNPLESFKVTLLSSSYASSIALLHGDLSYAAFRELVEASLRTPLTGLDPEEVLEIVRRDGVSLYEELEVRIAKVLATSYIRELYWASGGSLNEKDLRGRVDRVAVLTWLMAKASVGRLGLPSNPLTMANRDGVEIIVNILEASGDKILSDVRREQETIFKDISYTSFLKSLEQRS